MPRQLLTPPTYLRPSQVEELTQQIRILQAVGYNTVELDEGSGGRGSSSGVLPAVGEGGSSGGSRLGGSLEAMLLSKNRHLEHELTMSRLKVVDQQQGQGPQQGQLQHWRRDTVQPVPFLFRPAKYLAVQIHCAV